jgi:hypothetical protein
VTDPAPIWVMYVAQYDVGRQHSRIIPESVRVMRTSRDAISLDQLEAERERTGLGAELTVTQMDVPADVPDREMVTYATQQIANEPEFDFWAEVIGDDIVVQGIVYSSDLYTHDGEGGVRELTEDEQAARRRHDISQELPPVLAATHVSDVAAEPNGSSEIAQAEPDAGRADHAHTTPIGPLPGRITELRHRATDLRASLASNPSRSNLPSSTPGHGVDGHAGTEGLPFGHAGDTGLDPPDQVDVGL